MTTGCETADSERQLEQARALQSADRLQAAAQMYVQVLNAELEHYDAPRRLLAPGHFAVPGERR